MSPRRPCRSGRHCNGRDPCPGARPEWPAANPARGTIAGSGTGFMHEAFDQDDPARFTRPWFAWAHTLFAELLLRTYGEG
ncbi:MAG TPA: glycoside hydrolase family 125 protein [Symbiobacteriaceae bacterium]|nr:glycoside hydrolase family 125 protein [Symbiobacteriaceae bacterium]